MWKGYDFGIPDRLQEEALVSFSTKAKSLYLTPQGLQKAKALVEKLNALE